MGGGETAAPAAAPGRLAVSGEGVAAQVDLRRRGATFAIASPAARGTLTLAQARRGPAALGFDLGGFGTNPRGAWNWALPIARASVRGDLEVGGRRIAMTGWLASYEHGWGRPELAGSPSFDLWDSWVVHRGPHTWVAHGMNRRDTVTGPGARDAQWLGMLARVSRGGMRLCRPRVDRRRWSYHPLEGDLYYADRLRARCGGMDAAFGTGRASGSGPIARVGGRGRGWVWHDHAPD